MLRARFGIPHHDERTGAYLHDRGDNSVVQLSGRELSEIETTPLGGGPTQVHDEVAHTIGAALIPTALGTAARVTYERSMGFIPRRSPETAAGASSTEAGGALPGFGQDATSDSPHSSEAPSPALEEVFSDVSWTLFGITYHLDVRVLYVNTATVAAACRAAAGGVLACLRRVERSKLRRARAWLATGQTSLQAAAAAAVAPPAAASADPDASPMDIDSSASASVPAVSRSQSIFSSAVSATSNGTEVNIGISSCGTRVFVPFVVSSTGLLAPAAAAFVSALNQSAKDNGRNLIAMAGGSLAQEATWASRTFGAWAKQRISLAVSGMHGVVIQDVLDRDRLVSTKRRGKTATGRPAHQVRYSAEAQQRRQLKLAKPMLSSLRASASVVVA